MLRIEQRRVKLTIDSTTKSGYSDFVPADDQNSTSRGNRSFSRLLAVVGLALTLAFVNVSAASANPILLSTRTATSTNGNPDRIIFLFNKPIDRFGIALLRSGTRVPATNPERGTSPAEAIVPIGDLPDGPYQLVWEANGSDGTTSSGSLSFVVTSEDAAPVAVPTTRRVATTTTVVVPTTFPPTTFPPTALPPTTPAPANVTAPQAVVTAPAQPVVTAPAQPVVIAPPLTQPTAPAISLRPTTTRPPATTRPASTRPATTLQPPQQAASNRADAPSTLPPVVAAPSPNNSQNAGNPLTAPPASATAGAGASQGSVRADQVRASSSAPSTRSVATTRQRATTIPPPLVVPPSPTTPILEFPSTDSAVSTPAPSVLGAIVQNPAPATTRTRPSDDAKPALSVPAAGQIAVEAETGLPSNNTNTTLDPSFEESLGSSSNGSSDGSSDVSDSETAEIALPATELPSVNQLRGGFNAFARTQLFTVLAWTAMLLAMLWALFGRRPAQFLARRLQQLSGATIAASVVLALAGVFGMLNNGNFSAISLARIVGLIAVISFAAVRFGVLRRALPVALTARTGDEVLPRSLRVDQDSSPGRWRHSGRLTRRVRKACWIEILLAGLAIVLAFVLAFAR